MARSGIGGYVTVGTETTWNTPVTPTVSLPLTSESVTTSQEYMRTFSLRAGQLGQSSAQHTQTTRSVGGSLSMNVLNKGMGKLLNLLNGAANAPTTPGGATLARLFTFDIGLTDPSGKSITYQAVRPDVGGTNRAFTYSGVKCAGVTFGCEVGGVLTSEWSFDGADETTATAAVTATYPASAAEFSFSGGSIELDDSVVLDCIRSASIEVALPHDTERFCFGTSGVKKEQILNGAVAVTCSFDAEFSSLTQYTAFRNATRRKLELNFTGAQIESGQNFEFNFTMPTTVATGEGPVLSGPDVIMQSLTFEAVMLSSSTPLLSIGVKTTDTAL